MMLREAMPSMSNAEFDRTLKEIRARRGRASRAAARRDARALAQASRVGPVMNGFERLRDTAVTR
jgi:hypothetical protein